MTRIPPADSRHCTFMAVGWQRRGADSATADRCPKMSLKLTNLRQKGHSQRAAARDGHLNARIPAHFGDNAFNGIVAFRAQYKRRARNAFGSNNLAIGRTMSSLIVKLG